MLSLLLFFFFNGKLHDNNWKYIINKWLDWKTNHWTGTSNNFGIPFLKVQLTFKSTFLSLFLWNNIFRTQNKCDLLNEQRGLFNLLWNNRTFSLVRKLIYRNNIVSLEYLMISKKKYLMKKFHVCAHFMSHGWAARLLKKNHFSYGLIRTYRLSFV